ncbi:hypothetical protein Y032_0019g3948 [Ancylostoma ceylanicum]|uniref:Uncharacterized protein n=1 Tax=Ancylostoma ceylanicum TaxID=53326 RepID=A0A016V3T5_9BILA|nr:hypothetical protein Y032_0019g3948 [Ancylostoma ceylanicum]
MLASVTSVLFDSGFRQPPVASVADVGDPPLQAKVRKPYKQIVNDRCVIKGVMERQEIAITFATAFQY